jgi:hypothetical protein
MVIAHAKAVDNKADDMIGISEHKLVPRMDFSIDERLTGTPLSAKRVGLDSICSQFH